HLRRPLRRGAQHGARAARPDAVTRLAYPATLGVRAGGAKPQAAPVPGFPRRSPMHLTVSLLSLLVPLASEKPAPAARTVAQVTDWVRKSVVLITTPGRDGRRQGLGTGLVVGDGLVATNLHVVGEGRAVTVETADGKRYEATAVHAFDRQLDLAV